MFKKNPLIKNDATNNTLLNKVRIDEITKKSLVLVGPTDVAIIEKSGVLLNLLEEGTHPVYDKKTPGLFSSNKQDDSYIDIIYINKTMRTQILWGTPNYLNILDPIYNVPLEIGSSGEIEIQILNPRKFYLELVGRNNEFTAKDLKKRITNKLLSSLEPTIADKLYSSNLSGENILIVKNDIESTLQENLQLFFMKNYGIKLLTFSISKMFLTENSLTNIKRAKDKQNNVDEEDFIEATLNINSNEKKEIQQDEEEVYKTPLYHPGETEIEIETTPTIEEMLDVIYQSRENSEEESLSEEVEKESKNPLLTEE